MRKNKIIALSLASAILLSACSSKDASGLRANTSAYMTIDGKAVSNKDFYKQFDFYTKVYSISRGITKNVQNLFLRNYVIDRDITNNKIEISEDDKKKAVEEAVQNIGGQANYENYLKILATSKEDFEANILADLKFKKHQEWYTNTNKAKDEEVSKYYEENKASLEYVSAKHILVEDEAKANEVVAKLKAGEDFKKVSDQYSTDQAAKANGGELGKVTSQGFDVDFVKAAFALKIGEVSEPIKTQFGYHIVVISEKKVGKEALSGEINTALGQNKYFTYLNQEISKLEVKNFDPDGKEVTNKAQVSPAK